MQAPKSSDNHPTILRNHPTLTGKARPSESSDERQVPELHPPIFSPAARDVHQLGSVLRVNPDLATLQLFNRDNWKRVRFGDVVENLNETESNLAEVGVERLIGLEHLEPGSLHIHAWGKVADGTTFTRRCRPGQVLFGKRRAYQRKVAVVEFDAVVSGDIYVFAPKNDRLVRELLPFICLSERFFQHAVGTSAGSLSPRTNWSSLASFEFDLPPLDQQRRIAEILWAVDEMQSWYLQLQEESWAYLNSLLEEYITPRAQHNRRLAEVFTVKHGWAFVGEFFSDSGQKPILLTPGNFGLNGELYFTDKNTKHYSGNFPDDYVLSPGDIVTVMTDLTPDAKLLGMPAVVGENYQLLHNQRIGKMQFDRRELEPRFAFYLLLSDTVRRQIRRTASGSTVRHTSPARILEAVACIPPLSEQVALVRRFDVAWSAHKSYVDAVASASHLAATLRETLSSSCEMAVTKLTVSNTTGQTMVHTAAGPKDEKSLGLQEEVFPSCSHLPDRESSWTRHH